MPTRALVIAQPEGLHARPAAQFVKLAAGFSSSVKIRAAGREANGKSILSVLALGASQGTAIELDVQGADSEPALETLGTFLAGGGS